MVDVECQVIARPKNRAPKMLIRIGIKAFSKVPL